MTLTRKGLLIYGEELLKYDFGPTHPFKPYRERRLYEILKELNFIGRYVDVEKPQLASRDVIELAHDSNYVDYVIKLSSIGYGYLDYGDTPVFPGIYEATAYRVGASIQACNAVLKRGYDVAFNPGGGFHHARRSSAAGFCVFNDIVVAVRYVQKYHNIQRVAIFDMDVHHADGTQEELYREKVLTISMHMYAPGFYPGTGWLTEIGEGEGRGYNVNIPLPPLTGDDAFIYAFKEVVIPVLDRYKPELIIVQFGGDSLYDDKLGRLRLTTYSYVEVIEDLKKIANKYSKGKLVILGGGGYNYEHTARAWALGFIVALNVHDEEVYKLHDPKPTSSNDIVFNTVKKRVRELKSLLNL